jgi:hypothetical protein
MEEAATLNRSWLLLTAPACVIGIGLVVASVVFLLRTIRVPEFARLPLVPASEVERLEGGQLIGDVDLQDGGPLMFVIDKPRFSNVQASVFKPFALSVSLEDSAGRVVKADPVLVPVSVQGVNRTRVDIARLAAIEPGRYRLRVAGLAPDVAGMDSLIVIARPIERWKMVAGILAIIVSAALTLGGLIASVATFVKFQSG